MIKIELRIKGETEDRRLIGEDEVMKELYNAILKAMDMHSIVRHHVISAHGNDIGYVQITRVRRGN